MALPPLHANEQPTELPSSRSAEGRYHNLTVLPRDGVLKKLRIGFKYLLLRKPANTRPSAPLPVQPLSRQALLDAPDNSLWRLGHSTMLIKASGQFYLTDPVFSERASPVQWAGPRRFHAPPLDLAELPALAAVIISHNHYDHLDHASVMALAATTEHFLAPLGVGDTLVQWGIPAAKVRQLDWWQETELAGIRFAATPAQHFSGRGLFDSNQTLWASWVMIAPGWRLFFSGDSGYFDGFKRIGERYGPFDLAMVETGAYNVAWPSVHMQPEESLKACQDVKGRWMLPIHNGTFDLSIHAWQEPFERITRLAEAAGMPLATPRLGERLDLLQPQRGTPWWREALALSEAEPAYPR
ncbi:MBL fold metallo-hydrolase [Pseudomonas sp. RIT-PI-S]|uniref:MBL fold metallo-hydrolase n=1 Tax=Pseudomonas sp. RIT-PI-S TaxID=3035295 RepID=UPI0021D8DCE7|nr:MBL fold metallo-hydrolase [Pseudomonas sp. RIT-PI-S]